MVQDNLPRPITSVASSLGISEQALIPYGREMAKVDLSVLNGPRLRSRRPRLVLVSAITPTKAGEGKTTTTIGLGDGLSRIGESVCIALREPSLGPCLGAKGGGTGGGKSQLVPSDRINLHFTGDFHAITSAHNLLAAAIDNHLHFETEIELEPRRVLWPRVIDMNDRALRNLVIGLGGKANGVPRETSFDITAASELMAMLCLSSDLDDLRVRIDRTLIGFTKDDKPVTAKQIGVTGAMLALLRDAIHPNLVQTREGTPAFVHGGPFANIAHGCNSVIATRAAMHFADWTVTEAGFGFDLGAEKFYDIKLRAAGLETAAVVLVATVRALKMHGGHSVAELAQPDADAVRRGLPNLVKHIENIRCFGETPVVALNRFHADTEEELQVVRAACRELDVPFALSDHYARGGEGAIELARTVVEHAEKEPSPFTPLYPLEAAVPDKIFAVASKMYGARSVVYTKTAEADLKDIVRLGYDKLPVCIAKTQSSLSDDPKLGGRPTEFDVTVRNIRVNSGAGFLVVLTGDILRMPGLPSRPAAETIDVENGVIKGLF
jgi:formate--tetrahydrofolate ligase